MGRKIELKAGQVVRAAKARTRCKFRRIVWAGLAGVLYSTGGDVNHYCHRRQFLRWMREQRRQKKRRRVPADLFSVQPGA